MRKPQLRIEGIDRGRRPSDRGARWVAATFDARAATYDRSEMHRWQAERAVRLLDPRPGQRVLDVAAGTGLVARRLADAVGTPGLVVGLDLSEQMLRAGPGRWYRVRADTHHLPFRDGSFDAVTCVAAIPYFADVDQVLREWWRVTAPGATVLLNLPAADGLTVHRLVRTAAAEHGLAVGDPHAELGNEARLRARLEPLGFSIRRVEIGVFRDRLTGDPQDAFARVLDYGFAEEVRRAPAELRTRVAATYARHYASAQAEGENEHRVLFAQATREAFRR